jgi:D-alanyl-D-alanine carboxypeptidase
MTIAQRFLLALIAACLMLDSQTSYGRHAALLIDADNGNVLYEMEANQSWYPASLTKLMTLYMTFSALESGRLRLSDQLNVSPNAARQPTSKLGLRTWESISVEDAILAIITRSANDASVVLAEALGGTERQFAIKMTSTAHGLGMYGSHFMNATGLPHDWQTTTAHDMATLALRIIRDFPRYYSYFRADSLYFHGRELRGINKFTANYPGAEGMKTGYTCGSGYNLVASASLAGKRLIGVVLGGMSSSERYEHMFTMMDSGFYNGNDGYASKNIHTMSKQSIGTPPYQLHCGHRPSSHYAINNYNDDEDDHKVRYVRKAAHASHIAASHRSGDHERISHSTHTLGRHHTLALAKAEKHNSKAVSKKSRGKAVAAQTTSKSSRNNQRAEKMTTAQKSKSSAKNSKSTQIAKANSRKGYYTADKKESTKKASAGGKKGYYNPASTTKTAAKANGKSKRKSKS